MIPEPTPPAIARLSELFAKIEAFFAAARVRHGQGITCHAGCADCCQRRFSVTAIEAAVIREGLRALSHARREELARRADEAGSSACPALDPDGRCAIYAVRPVICRTHGLPIKYGREARGHRALPVIDACPKNFVGRDLAQIDAASVLDQTTLSTVLGALDAAHADAEGRPRGERAPLSSVLAGA